MTTMQGGPASGAALSEQYLAGAPSHTATSETLLSDRAVWRRQQPPLGQPRRVRLTLATSDAVMAYVPPEPNWLWSTLDALQRLSVLPANWDSYGGAPISDAAVVGAINTLAQVLSQHSSVPIIVPTSAGGVQLEWHRQGVDLEIEIGPNGRLVELFLSDPHRGRGLATQTPGASELQHVVEAVAGL